eukprot:GHVQ01007902.1.p1 GENE.GHVQ01007902.1~~GHVQ01007902.1.p1  ORF type:complete len:569 (-),score=50.68 GHVQ01007902.1:270-1976(-)
MSCSSSAAASSSCERIPFSYSPVLQFSPTEPTLHCLRQDYTTPNETSLRIFTVLRELDCAHGYIDYLHSLLIRKMLPLVISSLALLGVSDVSSITDATFSSDNSPEKSVLSSTAVLARPPAKDFLQKMAAAIVRHKHGSNFDNSIKSRASSPCGGSGSTAMPSPATHTGYNSVLPDTPDIGNISEPKCAADTSSCCGRSDCCLTRYVSSEAAVTSTTSGVVVQHSEPHRSNLPVGHSSSSCASDVENKSSETASNATNCEITSSLVDVPHNLRDSSSKHNSSNSDSTVCSDSIPCHGVSKQTPTPHQSDECLSCGHHSFSSSSPSIVLPTRPECHPVFSLPPPASQSVPSCDSISIINLIYHVNFHNQISFLKSSSILNTLAYHSHANHIRAKQLKSCQRSSDNYGYSGQVEDLYTGRTMWPHPPSNPPFLSSHHLTSTTTGNKEIGFEHSKLPATSPPDDAFDQHYQMLYASKTTKATSSRHDNEMLRRRYGPQEFEGPDGPSNSSRVKSQLDGERLTAPHSTLIRGGKRKRMRRSRTESTLHRILETDLDCSGATELFPLMFLSHF